MADWLYTYMMMVNGWLIILVDGEGEWVIIQVGNEG